MAAGAGDHAAAIRTLDGFMEAINTWDEARLCEVLYFPHYRLSQGQVTVWADAETCLRDFRDRAGLARQPLDAARGGRGLCRQGACERLIHPARCTTCSGS
jgi:hypothetical protein